MTLRHKNSGLEFQTAGPVIVGDNPNNVGFVIYIPEQYFFDETGHLQPNPPGVQDVYSGIPKPTGWIVVRGSDFVPAPHPLSLPAE